LKLLIDSDSLIFSAGFAVEKKHYTAHFLSSDGAREGSFLFDNKKEVNDWMKEFGVDENEIEIGSHVVLEPVAHAFQAMDTLMESIFKAEDLEFTDFQLYLSGSGNFRKLMPTDPVYKGNRDPAHRPTYEENLRQYLIQKYGAVLVDGMEADDAVGIAQCETEPETTVLVSIDKDLDQIPGWHYNYQKKKKYFVTEEEGTRFFWKQMLTGDTSDNIRGIYGIGPVKADKMLGDSADDYETIVWDAYINEFGGDAERMFRQNQELLWILRAPRSA
jgi:hypothetical protein